jgi:hypothetical protein
VVPVKGLPEAAKRPWPVPPGLAALGARREEITGLFPVISEAVSGFGAEPQAAGGVIHTSCGTWRGEVHRVVEAAR